MTEPLVKGHKVTAPPVAENKNKPDNWLETETKHVTPCSCWPHCQ